MRVGLKYQINSRWAISASEEIHINVGKDIVRNVFDQNRLTASLSYKINPKISLDAGYLYWFQQSSSGDDFFSRNIIFFSLKQNLKFY